MADAENVFDGFALLSDDEEFDVDKIFCSGSDEPAPPPPAPGPAEENSLGNSFRRLQAQKVTPFQRQHRSKALRQDPKHNCRSLTSRPFFSMAAPESRSRMRT